MASVEGLTGVQNLINGTGQVLDNQLRQQAAQKSAELFKSGDIKGALSTLAAQDPDHAAQMIQQFQQFDPTTKQALSTADETGKLDAQTSTGSNPRQLLDTEIAAGKFDKSRDPETQRRAEDSAFKRQERYQNDVSKIQQKLNEGIQYSMQADVLADEAVKNPQAALNLGRTIIKAIEGPGARVSDKDYETAVGDKALGQQAWNNVNKLANGTIRNVTRDQLKQMIQASRQVLEMKSREVIDQKIKQYSIRAGVDLDEAYRIANVIPPHESILPKNKASSAEQSAMDWIKANPNDPRVPKIKEKLGIK